MLTNALRPLSTEELVDHYAVTRDERARELIIERHESLVRSLGHKFARPGVAVEDLMQCAWIALLGALDRYDAGKDTKFSTYAVHCMVGEIKRYFRDRTWSIKAPRHLQEIAANLGRIQDRLYTQLQREPTIGEMAEAFKVSEEELLEAMELGRAYQPMGFHERQESGDGQNAMPLSETLGKEDGDIEALVEHSPLDAAMATLDDRRQRILRLRFFQGWSQQEVADALQLSQMHVSRLERSALRHLKMVMSASSRG